MPTCPPEAHRAAGRVRDHKSHTQVDQGHPLCLAEHPRYPDLHSARSLLVPDHAREHHRIGDVLVGAMDEQVLLGAAAPEGMLLVLTEKGHLRVVQAAAHLHRRARRYDDMFDGLKSAIEADCDV